MRLHRSQPTIEAINSCTSGRSVETAKRKANIFASSVAVHWLLFNPGKPIASHPTISAVAISASTNQMGRCLRVGQIHWQRATAGMSRTSQNKCTETSALVGGSQPPAPHSAWQVGIGT